MDTVCVADGVGELFGGEWAPLFLIDGGVGVLAVARELGDVEERDGGF